MEIGCVVEIYAAVAGYRKYHLCLKLADEDGAACFLFINSDPNFSGTYAVDCERLPYLPASKTGKSCFSFSMVPRHNEQQLQIFKSKVLGEIDLELAIELRSFAESVRTLARPDHVLVKKSLDAIVEKLGG
jgi:hypothetical protein